MFPPQAIICPIPQNGWCRLLPAEGTLAENLQADLTQKVYGKNVTYADQHEWMGFTAAKHIIAFLDEVKNDPSMSLDIFAYDFNLPEVVNRVLALANHNNRVRIILDDSDTGTAKKSGIEKDDLETMFIQKAGQAAIQRTHFSRLAHDKIFIQKKNGVPVKVLTGATNFSQCQSCPYFQRFRCR